MAEPALRRMSMEEFLAWDAGDDLRYELVGGFPVAQSAPSGRHGGLVANLASTLRSRIRDGGRPCTTEAGGALRIEARGNVRVPDLLVRCGSRAHGEGTPVLAVDVLSPSNSATEMADKRDDYAAAGINDVLEVEQDTAVVRHFRREGPFWVQRTVKGLDASLTIDALGVELPLADIYDGVALDRAQA